MKRLRICQLITELGPAGAERCIFELATRLDRRRFDVCVAALRGGAYADRLRNTGVPVTVLGVRGKWDATKLFALARMLRRERIDLVHTHLFHADLVGRPAAQLAGTPRLVHTVHVAEARFRPWQFAWARLAAGACDRIVCVSLGVRDFHARRSGLPKSRYEVIHNGIDPAAYARDESARRKLRAEWGVGESDVLAVFVGRLDRQKGVDTLLAAMDCLRRRGRGVRLVIAGDGPERGLVARYARDHGDVRALGRVDDVRGVLSAADMLAMPSRWEGFGLAAAEAMAASLPVAATRVPGLEELVTPSCGLLVASDDAGALADAIARLSDDADLRKRLGENGRRRIEREFTVEKMVAAHERLYEELGGADEAG